jgi:hypothetical protein
MTFGKAGEATLSQWMAENARVCWIERDEPWTMESELISQLDLPLNLDQNRHNRFHSRLTEARSQARQRARELAVSAWLVGLTSPADINGGERWCTGAAAGGSASGQRVPFWHTAPRCERTYKTAVSPNARAPSRAVLGPWKGAQR